MKIALFMMALLGSILLIPLSEQFGKKKMATEVLRQPPSQRMVEIAVMEFKNLASDIFFFDSITFVGGKRSSQWSLQEREWLYSKMRLSTALNPYSRDVYFLAQSVLTWEAHMYEETNSLLELALRYREEEWVFPFFMGFNYFYFLDNPAKGAEYLQQAINKEGAPKTFLISLASRLYSRAGQTDIGLMLLKDAVKQTADEGVRRVYETRIKALEGVLVIEKAIAQYERKFRKYPNKIEDLIRAKLLSTVPSDPYGGRYYIDEQGRVRSTSELKR